MFEEMVNYHSILIYITVGLLMVGTAISFLSKSYQIAIKLLRVYMFIIHSSFTMVAFSGLVAFAFAKMGLNLSIFAMIIIYILLVILESIKYLKSLRANSLSKLRVISLKYILLNMLLILSMIIWEILEGSSAVSVP